MGQPYSFIGCGTYTNPATIVTQMIPLTDKPDWFYVKDKTNWGAQTTAANPIYAEWFSSMANDSYLALGQPSSTGSGVTTYASQGTSGGFTFINTLSPPTFTKVALTAINGTTFVVSTTNTAGINVGDIIRLINIVGAQQLSSVGFEVTAVSANTSITLGLAATAAAVGGGDGLVVANGTTGFYQKIYPTSFYPNTLPILAITRATQAKVYFARPNPYTAGELVDFYIPVSYGMVQLNALTGVPGGAARVLVVTNTATESSITINVNTSGYTAFAWPTSANYANSFSPATCQPAGSGVVPLNGSATIPQSPPGTNLVDAFDNRNQYVMQIGTSACGVANAAMEWFAFKADFNNAITNA